ncbi:hypothetical protein ABF162_07475 [Vibrio coralliilyticus]|uniref:hypothetical protein n=1 Tax=Vibrio coralliilyticus TaxID=190893 RepID=UPI00345E8A67
MPTRTNKLKPCSWEAVSVPLLDSLGDYHDKAAINVRQGKEFTFICEGAAMLLRGEGDELVVVGFTGKHQLEHVAPHIVTLAKQSGARSIRCHTERRGECRYLNRLGYPFQQQFINHEYVLRMVLDGR